MTGPKHIAADHGFATNAESCVNNFGRCAYRAVMRAAQSFFQRKERSAVAELHFSSGHPIRTVQTWFADKHQGSASALIGLLATDAAQVVLQTIRAELKAAGRPVPAFYDDLEVVAEVAKAMRAARANAEQGERLDRMIRDLK